eukprot:CAMPEP_0177336884 /NCGR_PEP_ID=MMETSP0368-20130122/24024_1 /TAXON_ID=447022 ORGANISM="Scrippsiella hangoei-like, Strain SHHI-4" /NCGR_SAMPLE_ID=MMETSP0368 /ASSEMBLY_ACC=CAM_ASM_000363 /LENGTH=511 /DNA_ID=CAMNT_0018797767 /DNA_START=75 /DNA_END=1610 /DNA_ORIENTATION=-
MALMMRRVARKAAKYGIVGSGLGGTVYLANLYINDDMDDIAYFARGMFRGSLKEARKKVVVLGSGWGSLSFAQKLDPKLYDVVIVSPRPFFFYTPLLCGSTTGTVNPASIVEPIRDSASNCNFLHVTCKDVDLDAKKVLCAGESRGSEIALDYDHLVIAVGAQPNTFGIKGVAENAFFLKEIEHGNAVRKQLLDTVMQADVARVAGNMDKIKQLLNIVVVGGGPTGVEFCGELSDFIKKDLGVRFPELKQHFQVTLIEALPGLLTMFQKAVGVHVQEHLVNQGVDVRLNAMVKEAEKDKVHIKTQDGSIETINFGTLVWVAGVGMRPFTKKLCDKIGADAGQTDRRGLLVDHALRVKGTNLGEVFALGDCAVSGKPPTAQVAAQQGKYLGRMFRFSNELMITDPEAAPFSYAHQGTMAYIGDSQAATEVFPNGLIKLGQSSITDHLWWRSLYGDVDHVRVMGVAGFAVWRSVYFSKMYSMRSRFSVGLDWSRTALFGRPSAAPTQGTLTCE